MGPGYVGAMYKHVKETSYGPQNVKDWLLSMNFVSIILFCYSVAVVIPGKSFIIIKFCFIKILSLCY